VPGFKWQQNQRLFDGEYSQILLRLNTDIGVSCCMMGICPVSDSHQRKPKTALVILNPAAGNSNQSLLYEVVDELERLNWTIFVRTTTGVGDAERIASSGQLDQTAPDILIVSGGDGTINEVVNGLVRSARHSIPVGLIPAGTANLLASELGFKKSPRPIVEAIINGTIRTVTLGKIVGEADERFFLVTAGVGFDANSAFRVSKSLKRVHGKTAYIVAGIMEYVLGQFPSYRLMIGSQQYLAGSILVANGKYYAGRLVWAPDADICKPVFQIGLFKNVNRRSLPVFMIAMASGLLPKLKGFYLTNSTEIILKEPVGQPVQADGDVVANLPVSIGIADQRARFFAVEHTPADF